MGVKPARERVQTPAPRARGKRADGTKGRRGAVGRAETYRASGPFPPNGAPLRGGAAGRGHSQQTQPAAGPASPNKGAGERQPASAERPPARLSPWLCREVMSENPPFCLLSDPADVAARLMVTEDTGSLPVVSDLQTNKLVGIVTDRDLTVKVVAEGQDPKGIIVEEVMTPGPVACHVTDNVRRALAIMDEHQLRRVPVVDDNGYLVGFITQVDIATRVAGPEKTGQETEERSRPPTRPGRPAGRARR